MIYHLDLVHPASDELTFKIPFSLWRRDIDAAHPMEGFSIQGIAIESIKEVLLSGWPLLHLTMCE